MNKPYPDARPGRGIKAEVYKLLDNNINQIRDTAYPWALINSLMTAVYHERNISQDKFKAFVTEWLQDNNIELEEE